MASGDIFTRQEAAKLSAPTMIDIETIQLWLERCRA